ncbi:Nnf1-domain-containing protein [Hypoxylon sp. FL1284]|nr:Nnf1-domain-containing protein [Hypoxylon sp. FL1284]
MTTDAEEAASSHQQQDEQQQGQGPASPPLPSRHTAVTPGPRASRFQDLLASSLSHALGKISWDNFAACYPTVAAQAPGVLRAVQKQMVDRLGALCKKEFDTVLQSRNVVAKLNELESLVSEAERRRDDAGVAGAEAPIPPHMLPPDQVLAAHLAPHLAQQQSQLNAKLQTVQAHNANLFDDIQRQRAEMQSLMSLLRTVFDDIDAANGQMDDVVDDLAEETRMVEAETVKTR